MPSISCQPRLLQRAGRSGAGRCCRTPNARGLDELLGEPGLVANWITNPTRGIEDLPVEYEYAWLDYVITSKGSIPAIGLRSSLISSSKDADASRGNL
jgi:hypothetical protein